MARLGSDFYGLPTLELAKSLLGCRLTVSFRDDGGLESRCSGLIVETEAYLDRDDPACHASRGMTRRNEVMFGSPGRLYVYTIHTRFCVNVVSEAEGRGAAVLIRAIEPVEGIPTMLRNRTNPGKTTTPISPIELGNGPGKLCQALGIDLRRNGDSLIDSPFVWIEHGTKDTISVTCTPRIGISQGVDLPYRFFVDGNRYVSGRASDHQQPRRSSFMS